MKAALYFRVSTDEQKERASIETQREFAAQYCKVHEIEVIASYSTTGSQAPYPLQSDPVGSNYYPTPRPRTLTLFSFTS